MSSLTGPSEDGNPSQAESLLFLRNVFDQMPAAMCLLRGPDHLVQFANPAYRALVGGRAVEGMRLAEALPEVRAQGFIDILDGVYRTGEEFVGREVNAVLLREGGPVDVVVDLTYQPLRGADGAVEGILVHAVDVTAGVRAREQLEEVLRNEHEDRFRKAVDSMIDTVMIASPIRDSHGNTVDFRLSFTNNGGDEIGRRHREQLIGRPFSDLWPNAGASGILASFLSVLDTGEPLILDDFRYDDEFAGEIVKSVFDIRATRIDGELFLVIRDVSERVTRERALAESHSRLAREHDAVVTLQAAILPRELPAIPGADVAAEYVAAYDNLEVGGDWFDVSTRPDGSVAIAIGDVAGKGIEAAQIMAQVRAAGRVATLTTADPAEVLTSQNAFMHAADLGPFATSVFAVYRPETGVLAWASAGHLPPLVVSQGRPRLLTSDPRPPLGSILEPGYHTTETMLAPGDRVVLYTDGLVERRAESISDGLDRLLRVVPVSGTPRTACRELLGLLDVTSGTGDDVCVLTLDRRSA